MSTRKLLLIILPLLFIFNNAVSYFIFKSSNSISQSYNQVLDRVLLYQATEEQINRHVNISYQYILDPSEQMQSTVSISRQMINAKISALYQLDKLNEADAAQWQFKNLITSFMTTEAELFEALHENDSLSYANYYTELDQLSSFISEESYQLIGLELSIYQKWYTKILLEINNIQYSGATLLIVNTLISLLIAYWISQRISRPIQKLVKVAEHISEGKLDTQTPTFPNHSEFKILAESFNQMQTNVKLLFEKEKETLEKDKLLTQMELEVLQNQINPHFLFNSLNVLSKLALIEGAEKTSDLTVSLSNLFRYNLRKLDKPVPLQDEVEHAKEYFYIQQARFRDHVTFDLDVDDTALHTLVPVLTLQPILENIFVHGIEGIERPAHISLKIKKEEHYTVINISDNGIGMDEETRLGLLHYNDIQKPVNNEQHKKSTGLGTKNVFRRIELLYEQHHLIDIYSEANHGTTVTIRIPNTYKGGIS